MSASPRHSLDPRPTIVTLFGEPVALPALAEVAIATLLAFHILGQDLAGAILAVLQAAFGIYQSWATRETALAYVVSFTKALFTLIAVFGLTLTDQQTGAILALATFLFTTFHRSSANPIEGSPSGPAAAQPVAVQALPEPVDVRVDTGPEDGPQIPSAASTPQPASDAGGDPSQVPAAPGDGGDGGF